MTTQQTEVSFQILLMVWLGINIHSTLQGSTLHHLGLTLIKGTHLQDTRQQDTRKQDTCPQDTRPQDTRTGPILVLLLLISQDMDQG